MAKIVFSEEEQSAARRILEDFDPTRTVPDCSNLVGRENWARAIEYLRADLAEAIKRCQVVKAVESMVTADREELKSSLLEQQPRTAEDDWFDELLKRLPRDQIGDSSIASMWYDIKVRAEDALLERVEAPV